MEDNKLIEQKARELLAGISSHNFANALLAGEDYPLGFELIDNRQVYQALIDALSPSNTRSSQEVELVRCLLDAAEEIEKAADAANAAVSFQKPIGMVYNVAAALERTPTPQIDEAPAIALKVWDDYGAHWSELDLQTQLLAEQCVRAGYDTALRAQIDERAAIVAEALRKAGERFREYGDHHEAQARALNPGGSGRSITSAVLDRQDKAKRNREMAEMCEAALEHTTALPTVPVDVVERVGVALFRKRFPGKDPYEKAVRQPEAEPTTFWQFMCEDDARAAIAALSRTMGGGIKELDGRIGDADRAGGLRPEPPSESQPEALIPCANAGQGDPK